MKYLFILILSSVTLYTCAQTNYDDLPTKASTSGTDGFTVYSGGSPYKMTNSVLFAKVNDTLAVFRDSLNNYSLRMLTLESGSTDSSWTSITVDTIHSGSQLTFTINSTGELALTSATLAPLTTSDMDLGSPILFYDQAYIDTVYIKNALLKLYLTGSELTLEDPITGPKTLAQLAASSVWTKSGTDLSPTTAGDDIDLTGSLLYLDKAGNDYIEAASYPITFRTNNTIVAWFEDGFMYNAVHILPSTDGIRNLGSASSRWWNASYINTMYIGSTATGVARDGSNNMTLTDVITGTKTLAELVGSSVDTMTMYAASIGRGLTGDSAQFQTGATYQRIWYAGPDSIQLDTARLVCDDGDVPNFTYNIIWQEERISGSWTNVWTTATTVNGADAITTGEITTTFTNSKIPPYSWIELIFEAITTKPTSVSLNLIGHYIQ